MIATAGLRPMGLMLWAGAVCAAVLAAKPLHAQTLLAENDAAGSVVSSSAASALPEAPSSVLILSPAAQQDMAPPQVNLMPPMDPIVGHAAPVAPLYSLYIPAGSSYYRLTQKQKVAAGARDLYNWRNLVGETISGGYSHVVDSAPNYGHNGIAFAQRVGASAARGSSQGIFTNMVFAPLFREDPRYFVEGPTHPMLHRLVYAATRTFITRRDDGTHTANLAVMTGYAAAAALEPIYYPPINRNFSDMATGYLGSLGGESLSFVVDEFIDQVFQAVHLEKKP